MLVIALFVLGAIVGSFLNVLILRLPQGRKANGRSACPQCEHQLYALDLIPILSYLFLRGRCRYCRHKISPRYIIIELFTASLFALVATMFPLTNAVIAISLARALSIVSVLIVVFVVDFEEYLILDKVIFPAIGIILGFNILIDFLSQTSFLSMQSLTLGGLVMGAIFFGLFYLLWYISDGRWIGFGDVKFMWLIGLSLGWPQTLVGLFLAFIIGGAFGTFLLITGKKDMQSKLPLGTFLSIGVCLALLWGESLLAWYWSLVMGGTRL